jgi:hypothetical protein
MNWESYLRIIIKRRNHSQVNDLQGLDFEMRIGIVIGDWIGVGSLHDWDMLSF